MRKEALLQTHLAIEDGNAAALPSILEQAFSLSCAEAGVATGALRDSTRQPAGSASENASPAYSVAEAMDATFLRALLSPTSLSRSSVHEALQHLGAHVPESSVHSSERSALEAVILSAVHNYARTCEDGLAGAWAVLMQRYTYLWTQENMVRNATRSRPDS